MYSPILLFPLFKGKYNQDAGMQGRRHSTTGQGGSGGHASGEAAAPGAVPPQALPAAAGSGNDDVTAVNGLINDEFQEEDDDLRNRINNTLHLGTYFHTSRHQGFPMCAWAWTHSETGTMFITICIKVVGSVKASHIHPVINTIQQQACVHFQFPKCGEVTNPLYLMLANCADPLFEQNHSQYAALQKG